VAVWLPGAALSAVDRAEPLQVPRGAEPALRPELRSPEARIGHAIEGFRARGYGELPVLAEAVLEVGGPDAARRAIELAPSIPAVRYAAGREQKSPLELARSVGLLFSNLPSLVWLTTWFGAALGLGVLVAVAVLVGLGFARTVEIHGHQIGHASFRRDPPSWPGALLVGAGLALLPLVGAGPALILALAGALTALRLPRAQGVRIGIGLLVVCVVLGPGLDFWSRVATFPGRDPAVFAAWRIERQQPLPGDRARLEAGVAARPDDPALRLANALAWKQAGDLERAERELGKVPAGLSPGLLARLRNLKGILLLARGQVRQATEIFESAAAAEESAAVLYNLSQAHGRALRLIEQGNLFAAARGLDPELVSRYSAFRTANVHSYLIQAPLPLATYLRWAIEPSPEAGALAREVRDRTLGPGLPRFTWQLVGVLGLASLLFRHAGIRRCTRCLRVICKRCSPELPTSARSCARCANLFSQSETLDARLRKQQIERDRRRLRGLARGLAALDLVAPGAARIFEGRIGLGWTQLLLAAFGLALLLTRKVAALPAEVGDLGAAMPTLAAAALLGPTYLLAASGSLRRLRAASRTP
jgi:tetratricopeptide (TPR) repeat protein